MSILSIYVCIYRISLALSFFSFLFLLFLLLASFFLCFPPHAHAAAMLRPRLRMSRGGPECGVQNAGVSPSIHADGFRYIHMYIRAFVAGTHGRLGGRCGGGGKVGSANFFIFISIFISILLFLFSFSRARGTRDGARQGLTVCTYRRRLSAHVVGSTRSIGGAVVDCCSVD